MAECPHCGAELPGRPVGGLLAVAAAGGVIVLLAVVAWLVVAGWVWDAVAG